jgi:hypothetical protein
MQATFTMRRFPVQAFAIALLTAVVLILGAAGGYWLRSLSATSSSIVARPAASSVAAPAYQSQAPAGIRGSSQGLFGSSNGSDNSNADLSTHRSGIQY